MSEITKSKRIEEIVEAVLNSRNVAPALDEEGFVSIKDYSGRLINLVKYITTTFDSSVSEMIDFKKNFLDNFERLGYINSMMLIKYIHKRIETSQEKGKQENLSELAKIPSIIAGITNGIADSRCMYDFLKHKLNNNFDMSITALEEETKRFAKEYVPSELNFTDQEQQQLKSVIDNSYNGDFKVLKQVMIEQNLTLHLRHILDILDKIEDLENKEAK